MGTDDSCTCGGAGLSQFRVTHKTEGGACTAAPSGTCPAGLDPIGSIGKPPVVQCCPGGNVEKLTDDSCTCGGAGLSQFRVPHKTGGGACTAAPSGSCPAGLGPIG